MGEVFAITVPLYVVLVSILGGARHWAGPALGAALITLAPGSADFMDCAVRSYSQLVLHRSADATLAETAAALHGERGLTTADGPVSRFFKRRSSSAAR